MTYDNALSIDELVGDKKNLGYKIVCVNGVLTKYSMGPGALTWPVKIRLDGEEWAINASAEISRVGSDPKRLRVYLEAYMGEEIGLKVRAKDYRILGIKFGDKAFRIRQK